MPVSPSGVSWISAFHFRTFPRAGQLWIWTGIRIRNHKNSLHAAGMLDPAFSSINLFNMEQGSTSSTHLTHWKFKNIALWNLRYSENGDLPEPFTRTFSLVMQFSHESEHTKLMTLLIINFTLAVFHLQSLSCEAINKSQGEFLPIAIISLCALFAPSQFQLLDYFSKFPFLNFSLEVRKPAFPHGIPGCCGWCCRFCGWMLWRKKSTGIFVT